MLRELLDSLRSGGTLNRAFSQLREMLDHAEWMFVRANDVLHGTATAEEVRDSIYSRDNSVNELERSIRRKVLRHLTINPGFDVEVCLALMSVAKDAERIGDYCKNVFEVGRFYTEGFHVPKYQEPLDGVSEQAVKMFHLVSSAIRNQDEALANQALALSRQIRRQCDNVIEELFKDESEIQVHEAVAYSLLARHYKRVASHLSNIATAVMGRVENLDFYPDKGSQG